MQKYGLCDNSSHRNFDNIIKTCKGICIKQNSDRRHSEIPGDLFNLKNILRFSFANSNTIASQFYILPGTFYLVQ